MGPGVGESDARAGAVAQALCGAPALSPVMGCFLYSLISPEHIRCTIPRADVASSESLAEMAVRSQPPRIRGGMFTVENTCSGSRLSCCQGGSRADLRILERGDRSWFRQEPRGSPQGPTPAPRRHIRSPASNRRGWVRLLPAHRLQHRSRYAHPVNVEGLRPESRSYEVLWSVARLDVCHVRHIEGRDLLTGFAAPL